LDFVPSSLLNFGALAGSAMIGSELLSDSSSQSDWTIGLFFGRPAVILTDLARIYKNGKKPQEVQCRMLTLMELIPFISYGKRGGAVIKNTLVAMYNYSNETTTASKPLTLEAYTTFVLIPYIVAMLIAEDLHTDVEGGWEAMQLGIKRGKRENGLQNPDPTLNEVFAANKERRLKGLDSSQQTKGAGRSKKGKENAPPMVCLYTCFVVDTKLILY